MEDNQHAGHSNVPSSGDAGAAVPDFDLKLALSRMDDDQELLNEVIDIFLEDHVESLRALRAAVASSDAARLQRAAHTIKGAVSNFVSVAATQAACRVELDCKEGRLQEALAGVPTLETTVLALADALRQTRLGKAA